LKTAFLNIFFFSLVSIYVFSTVGVCVIAHYCDGQLEKVSLFSKPSSCCDGEDNETDDCCENNAKHVTFQSDFTFYTLVQDCKVAVTQLFIVDPSLIHISYPPVAQSQFLADKKNHPPNLVQDDVVTFSVIRI
jgi:hypothetical protein